MGGCVCSVLLRVANMIGGAGYNGVGIGMGTLILTMSYVT
jgi:hypothetical protein